MNATASAMGEKLALICTIVCRLRHSVEESPRAGWRRLGGGDLEFDHFEHALDDVVGDAGARLQRGRFWMEFVIAATRLWIQCWIVSRNEKPDEVSKHWRMSRFECPACPARA